MSEGGESDIFSCELPIAFPILLEGAIAGSKLAELSRINTEILSVEGEKQRFRLECDTKKQR